MSDLIYGLLGLVGYGHPVHPVLTHLVVGPVIAAFLFDIIGLVFHRPILRTTAWHLSILAFVFWFLTVGIGIVDWTYFYAASAMPEIIAKLVLSGVLFLLLVSNLLLHRRLKEESRVPTLLLALSTLCVVAIGFFGANLVYGDGLKTRTSVSETITSDSYREARSSYATTGWVAVAFGHTAKMEGSDMYIGFIAEDGSVFMIDSYGVAPQTHWPT